MFGSSCVKSVVTVYINGRIVQDIAFTNPPVNPIGFHKRRFKAKSYLSYAGVFRGTLSLRVYLVSRAFYSRLRPISFMWGIVGKTEFFLMVFLAILCLIKSETRPSLRWDQVGFVPSRVGVKP